jgi:phage shock protein A
MDEMNNAERPQPGNLMLNAAQVAGAFEQTIHTHEAKLRKLRDERALIDGQIVELRKRSEHLTAEIDAMKGRIAEAKSWHANILDVNSVSSVGDSSQ